MDFAQPLDDLAVVRDVVVDVQDTVSELPVGADGLQNDVERCKCVVKTFDGVTEGGVIHVGLEEVGVASLATLGRPPPGHPAVASSDELCCGEGVDDGVHRLLVQSGVFSDGGGVDEPGDTDDMEDVESVVVSRGLFGAWHVRTFLW